MLRLKPFVPQGVCLSCDGCCRYPEKETVWAPLFLFEEILELTQKNILPSCLFTHPDIRRKRAARIDLISHEDFFICPCFETSDHKCKIYSFRPLECRLYPFLLTRKGNEVFLAFDKKCPYMRQDAKGKTQEAYVRYLRGFLRSEEFLRLAKNNPEIVSVYPQDLEILGPLSKLSHCLYGVTPPQPQR